MKRYGKRPNHTKTSFQMNNDDNGRWRFNCFEEMSQDDQLSWVKRYVYEVSNVWSEQAVKDVTVCRYKKRFLTGDQLLHNIELFYEFEKFKYEHRNKYETQQSLTAQIDRQQAEIEMLQKKYQSKCECFDRATEYIQQQKRKIKRLLEKS